MRHYAPARPTILDRLLQAAYVIGPVLMLASAVTFSLGIGLIPPGITSWVEGIIGSYGIVLFVVIYLDLAHRLSVTHPRLGALTAVTGLPGATAGFSMEFLRPLEYSLRQRGAGDAVWLAFTANPGSEVLSVAWLGPLFPITSVLLGLGFWRARTLPRWVAGCLVAAGVGFPLAQVGGFDWALHITYPGACLLWCIGLSWVGLRAAR